MRGRLSAAIVWGKDARPPSLPGELGRASPSNDEMATDRAEHRGGGALTLPQIAHDALYAADSAARHQALVALGSSGQADAAPPLLAALGDESLAIRNEAVEALRHLVATSGPELFPSDAVIQLVAGEGNTGMRIAALEVLQRLVREWDHAGALAELKRASRDVDPEVKAVANQLLVDLNLQPEPIAERRRGGGGAR